MTPRKRMAAMLAAEPDLLERMLSVFDPPLPGVVSTPAAAAEIVRPVLAGRTTEALVAVSLDSRLRVIETAVLTEGNDAFTVVCPKQIFRWCLTRKRVCSSLIIAHNHPSGDPAPSAQDRDVTLRVLSAGRLIGIHLRDHIIIGEQEKYFSFANEGCLL